MFTVYLTLFLFGLGAKLLNRLQDQICIWAALTVWILAVNQKITPTISADKKLGCERGPQQAQLCEASLVTSCSDGLQHVVWGSPFLSVLFFRLYGGIYPHCIVNGLHMAIVCAGTNEQLFWQTWLRLIMKPLNELVRFLSHQRPHFHRRNCSFECSLWNTLQEWQTEEVTTLWSANIFF